MNFGTVLDRLVAVAVDASGAALDSQEAVNAWFCQERLRSNYPGTNMEVDGAPCLVFGNGLPSGHVSLPC